MRCIFILDEWYKVSTRWGRFRLDRGAYEDYIAGKLWITWEPGKRNRPAPAREAEPLPPDVSERAVRLRELSARQGLYATLQARCPGARVQVPYKQRMRDCSIDELSLSVRSSNGLMRAGAGTFGRLWELMNRENGLRVVRNLGAKSEAEITRCFFDACYQLLTPGEQAIYWQRVLDGQGGGEET